MARPIMLVVSPSCTIDGLVPKYSVISGSVGRYMSMTNGPKALSAPRNIRTNILESVRLSFISVSSV